MKVKIRAVMLLSMLLIFLPTNVFADDDIEDKSSSTEIVSIDNEYSSENIESVDKVTLPESKDFESVETKNLNDQNLTEELDSKNQEVFRDRSDNSIVENISSIEEDTEPDSEDLEISEITEPEAVRGGSSGGGGGGGSSAGGSGSFDSGAFRFKKIDEYGNPMGGVSFKVTNLETGENHIVRTDRNGISNGIILAPVKTFNGIQSKEYKFSKSEIEEIIKALQKEDYIFESKPKNPEIFPENNNSTGNENNQNLDASNNNDVVIENGNYNFSKPVVFSKYKDFTIKLNISYGDTIAFDCGGASACYWPEIDHYESYEYENKTFDDLEKIDQEKIKSFAKNRLAQLIKEGKVKPRWGPNYLSEANPIYSYSISIDNNSSDNKDIYKFEELRSEGNLNHNLKTFYVKNNGEGKDPTWSYKLEDLNKKEEKNPPIIAPPVADITGPKLDISDPKIPSPVGGGSSVGGSGSGKGVPINNILFTIVNEKFKFETFARATSNNKLYEIEDTTDGKIVEQSENTKVTDKISFDKLMAGRDYKFVGKLINKRTGEEVKTNEAIVYEVKNLPRSKGETTITITFDSSKYEDGDEFVLIYDIFEDGKLAGFEKDLNNKAQSFKIVAITPPPEEETPPPEEETPPPEEETPPPKEETPPSEEETPPVEKEVEKENPKEELVVVSEKTVTPTPDYIAPKTYDPGIGLNLFTAILSGAAFTFLRKRR